MAQDPNQGALKTEAECWKACSAKENAPINYFVLDLSNDLEVKSSGIGSLKEIVATTSQSAVMVVFRIDAADEVIAQNRSLFGCIYFVGPVPMNKRAGIEKLATQYKKKRYFHWTRKYQDEDELEEELEWGYLSKELLKTGGAHKPTVYKCGDDVYKIK
eukprot:978977_1